MNTNRLRTHHACALGLVCLLSACHAPAATLTVTPLPRAASQGVNWGLLTPTRHLDSVGVPLAAGAFGDLGLTASSFPFYSPGLNGNPPGVYMADLGARTVYQLPAFGPATAPIAVSAGGQVVGVNAGGQLGVLDLNSQLILTYPQLATAGIVSASVDAYGNVVYTDVNGQVHLFNTATGQDFIVPTAGRGLGDVSAVAVSGDGRFLAYTGTTASGTNLYTTDLATGAQLTPPFVGGVPVDPGAVQLGLYGSQVLFSQGGQLRALDYGSGLIDNLPLVNNGYPVTDAAFLGGDPSHILYTQNGQFQMYDRRTGLVDTMPIVNRLGF